jgi:hypothetical protein
MSDIETDVRRFDASYPPSLFVPPVVPPAPTLTSLAPNTSVVGVPVTITITGTGFTAATQVKVDGTVIPSTFVSATSITVTGTPLVDGDVVVTVTNVNGTSNGLPYTVTLVVGDPQADVSQAPSAGNGGGKRKKADE